MGVADTGRQYYEGNDLQALVNGTDWAKVLPILYASTRKMIYKRFLSDPDRGIAGKTFKDFVHEVIELFINGERRCPKDIRLEQFLIASIRSTIYNHIRKQHPTLQAETAEDEILKVHYESINTSFDHVKIKGILAGKLKDEMCSNIFECWAEGISRPAEIRELYGYSEPEYNNAKKRLDRILIDIRKHLRDE